MGLLDLEPGELEEFARQKDLERAQEQIDAERALELQAKLDGIEAALAPLLKTELAAENEVTRISDRVRADFKKFKTYCDEQGFPSLPAPPQAIAEFLGGELKHGAAHMVRLNNSIRAIHAAVLGDPNPADDILVRAVLRCARQDKDNAPPQKFNGKGH
jgi:hypothetical protein